MGAAVAYVVSQKKDEPEVDPWAGSTGETEATVEAPEVDPAEVTTEPAAVEVTEIADADQDKADDAKN
ncbi:hypothetical protein [Ornithinimicrobium sp. INDO-MA30-4]|uniref:hypothetical protein n=1 Tax=Ornithinimicrobium sp. INDO-MA30-4 TaxID=2908651 RepID=UPI001F314713|nr:hypothetical protein [Ornithinimicrobium sp. INDO-MA30-4]UJH70023.1 hypothetical protein L0A91_12495 [Ornithinimicrobium sp. INDO-MA30-4]